MTATWDVGRQLGYMRSWSATRAAREEQGIDPVAAVEEEVRRHWGNVLREIQWPLTVIAGTVDDRG